MSVHLFTTVWVLVGPAGSSVSKLPHIVKHRQPASRCRNGFVTRGLKRSLAGVVAPSLTRGRSPLVLRRVAVASLALAYFPLTMPTRRPSASTSHASPTTPSSSVRQHRSADSHHAFTAMSGQPTSFYSSNTSSAAAHQQKIIHILVNRLRNKVLFPVFSFPSLAHLSQLPSNSGVDLTQVETDPAVDETVRCLVELSKDSLDIIGLALTEVLDKLSKVCFLPLLLSIYLSHSPIANGCE